MQSKRPITPDDVVLAPTLSDPQVSPDGSNVAFVLGEASRVGQHEKTAIWLMPVAGDEPARPFTSGDAHDFGPRWSPEGRFLAFISDRHERGKPQPYLIAVQGGEAERLPELKGEVKSLYWSPDGAMLAAIVVDAEPEERDRQVKDLDDAMVFGADWRFAHLWTIRLADRQVNQVTSGESHAVSPAWSPDSSRIALITVDSPWADATYSPALIDCYPLDAGAPTRIATVRGPSNGLRWSPDGSTLGFLSSEGRVSTDDALFVVPAAGGEARAVMPGYEGSVDWFDWAHDGKSLLVSAVEHEASALLRVAVSGGSSEPILPEQLRGHGYIGEQISYSADRKTLAVVRSSGEQPAEVWTGTAASLRRRTSFNADIEQWATGRVERLSWVGAEGIEISGLLVYPAGYTPGKRYPLVLHIHGGPTWFWSDHFYASWHDWAQYLASHGYAVLLPNPHGSAGRGAAFADSTLDDYGGKELTDDLRGVDQVIAMGVADPDRLGVGGWSHGGYMAAWAISQTDRFKAAVMGAGMSNLISDQGQNDIPRCNDQYFSKRTYEDPDLFMQRSPITYVQNIKTPVLILHGGADERVNPMQGREFYIALRLLGLPCMLVTYPREGHHVEERKHQTDLLRRVLDWYDRYLKGPARQA